MVHQLLYQLGPVPAEEPKAGLQPPCQTPATPEIGAWAPELTCLLCKVAAHDCWDSEGSKAPVSVGEPAAMKVLLRLETFLWCELGL